VAQFPVGLTEPPVVDGLASRPRVLNRIVDPDHLLTIAIAPTGAGKTVAARQSADARAVRTAWVRLAPGYGSARDLVALAARSLGLEDELAGLPTGADDDASATDPHAWAEALAALLDGEPTTLVIDDYHCAEGDATDPVVAEVVSLLDPQSKIIVCTTRRPSGLIGRLRAPDAAKVDVVDPPDIVCTPDELASAADAGARAVGGSDPDPEDDPSAAIDAALDDGRPDDAADLIAEHLSSVGTERAVRWFFRLSPARRRELPTVLAATQAAVDADRTLFDARRRVDESRDEGARVEAQFALGGVLTRRGELAAAAHAFADAGLGASGPKAGDPGTWLGIVRWWSGDLTGSRQALAGASDDLGRWATAEVELADGDVTAAAAVLASAPPGATGVPVVLGAEAHVAWAQGDADRAATLALAAYEGARGTGGFTLTAAATTYLWMMLDAGEDDEVLEIADFLDRRVGRHDLFTRTHVALLQLAVARTRADPRATERAAKRVADCRASGFAPIEIEARRRLTALRRDAPAPLEVHVLGPTRILIGGRPLEISWSRAAHEVVLYLALVQDQTATRNAIAAAVWPERDPADRPALVRRALAEIRRALEPLRPLGEPSAYLRTQHQRVVLTARTDYEDARSLADEGRPVDALARFQGDLLDDEPFLDWAGGLRRSSRSFRLELADRVAHETEVDPATQVVALELILAEQPWDTTRWTQLEQLHRRAGDTERADEVARRHADARAGFF
jgi:DNA-binding SARP family transcriptional activator